MNTILIISVCLHLISFSLMITAAIGLFKKQRAFGKGMDDVGKLSKILSSQVSELIIRNAAEKGE